jgi:hypothetical protein
MKFGSAADRPDRRGSKSRSDIPRLVARNDDRLLGCDESHTDTVYLEWNDLRERVRGFLKNHCSV